MTDDVTDPCAIVCPNCGAEHHIDAAGTRDERGRCRDCSGYLPNPTERQSRLFHKRLAQTGLHTDGYVTVGGYTPASDYGDGDDA